MQQNFSVVFDRNVEELQKELINAHKSTSGITVGLLIGHRSENSDFVVHLTPCQKYEQLETDGDINAQNKSQKSPGNKKKIEEIDSDSVLQHAKQTIRMLPGGTDILGLFAISDKKKLLENQAPLTKIMHSIHNISFEIDRGWSQTSADKSATYRYLLLNQENDSKNVTRNLTVISFGDSRTTSNLLPFNYQNLKFVRLNSTINLDNFLPPLNVSKKILKKSFQIQCQIALSSFLKRILDSHVTYNGRVRDDFDQLQSGGGAKSAQNLPTMNYDAQILLDDSNNPMENDDQKQSLVVFQHFSALMQFKGSLTSKIQLPAKFTFADAAKAVKVDIFRSLYSRIELHNEGMNVVEGEELDPEAYHRLPRRVYILADQNSHQNRPQNLLACDYLFESESVEDSVKNFKEILNLDLAQDQIQDDLEIVPDEDKLEMLSFLKTKTESISGASSTKESDEDRTEKFTSKDFFGSNLTIIYVILGVLIGLLACLLYFMMQR